MNNKSNQADDAKVVERESNDDSKQASDAVAKKEYGTPNLEYLGSIQKVTQYG